MRNILFKFFHPVTINGFYARYIPLILLVNLIPLIFLDKVYYFVFRISIFYTLYIALSKQEIIAELYSNATDYLYEGWLPVDKVFDEVAEFKIDDVWYTYVTPTYPIHYKYNLESITNPSTWKKLKGHYNSYVYIGFNCTREEAYYDLTIVPQIER